MDSLLGCNLTDFPTDRRQDKRVFRQNCFIEAAALAYEGMDDCICIPVDDAITGKALKLLVKLEDGVEFNPKKLTRFMSAKLEAHKVPHKYEQVSHIERTYNGKLNRKAYV